MATGDTLRWWVRETVGDMTEGETPRRTWRRAGGKLLRVVRITWAVNDEGFLIGPNRMFCMLMGYSFEEADHHPATRLLRPDAQPGDPELLAIIAGMARLKNGETRVEYIRTTWIQTKSGGRIDIPEAVMTRNPFQPRYEVYADVSVSIDMSNAVDRILLSQWQMQQMERNLSQLQSQVSEMQQRTLPEGAIREVAREVAQEELLEHDVSNVRPLHTKPRKKRSDAGENRMFEPEEFEQRLRDVLTAGQLTVEDVLREMQIRHRRTLQRYLAPFALTDETPAKTIRRLDREWNQRDYLI